MRKYNLIFLKNETILLSRKKFTSWIEIQNEHYDYMTSLGFEDQIELIEYIKFDYKLSERKANIEFEKLSKSNEDTVEIKL